MSIYRFADASPIKEATFRHANDRPPVALLAASDNVTSDQLLAIRSALESHGWDCVPANADGKEVLQVDGFKKIKELTAFLAANRYAVGTPRITAEAGDNPERTIKDWISQTSLKAAGWLNLVGDGALLISGTKSGRRAERNAGIFYTAGGLILVTCGNVKSSYHLRQVSERTADFLEKQVGTLPQNTGLSDVVKHKKTGVMVNVRNYMYRYPSQITLAAYTAGAASMLESGIKKGLNKEGWAGAGYGASSTLLKLSSFLIPEKTKKEDPATAPKHKNIFRRFSDWVHEKPLRLFGYGSLVSEVLLGIDAYDEYKLNPRQKSFIFKGVTTATYILADLLMAVSSKNHTNAEGKFDAEEQRQIEALAAETIARQPFDQRESLAYDVGGFLATQGEMKGNATHIGQSIMEQVEHMAHNPWALRITDNAALQASR